MFTDEKSKEIEKTNKIIYGQKIVQRKHDMSPKGSLTVGVDESGDMFLSIYDDEKESIADLEFCTTGSGGGGSPEVHKALRQLFVAMVKDQHNQTKSSRDGRFPISPEVVAAINS